VRGLANEMTSAG
jgi:glycosyltransferase involved in cell wall biosynthesis